MLINKNLLLIFGIVFLVSLVSAGLVIISSNQVIIEKNADNSFTFYNKAETTTLSELENEIEQAESTINDLQITKIELINACISDRAGECEAEWSKYPELAKDTKRSDYISQCNNNIIFDCDRFFEELISKEERRISDAQEKLNMIKDVK